MLDASEAERMTETAAMRTLAHAGEPASAGRAREAMQLAAIGGAALLLGVLVYLADRPAGTATGLPAGVWRHGPTTLFGAVGAWLPSFVHPFAFALVTVALRPVTGAPALRVCAAWWAVNVVFEVGQRPEASHAIGAALRTGFGQDWPSRALANYFLHGTFDRADLLAATAGAVAAAWVIHLVVRPRNGGDLG